MGRYGRTGPHTGTRLGMSTRAQRQVHRGGRGVRNVWGRSVEKAVVARPYRRSRDSRIPVLASTHPRIRKCPRLRLRAFPFAWEGPAANRPRRRGAATRRRSASAIYARAHLGRTQSCEAPLLKPEAPAWRILPWLQPCAQSLDPGTNSRGSYCSQSNSKPHAVS